MTRGLGLMPIGYMSELVALLTAGIAIVCFVLLPRWCLVVAVPFWLAIQRLVARGSRNTARPPQRGDRPKGSKDSGGDNVTASHGEGGPHAFVFSRDMRDDERPVAVVTGTNSGIGYHTAVGLAMEGYRVVCTCRNAALSEATAERIRKDATARRQKCRGNPKYAEVPETVLVDGRFFLECDDFKSIRHFVAQFETVYTRLNVLVNNAGMMRRRLEFSRYNAQLELHTAVNFLGPLLLTELLAPLIKASLGRVVYVSSAAHRFPQMLLQPGFFWRTSASSLDTRVEGLLLEALKKLNQGSSSASGPLCSTSLGYAFIRYGTSKLLNIYHAHYIARHYKIPACSLHPGCIGTNFSRDLIPMEWIKHMLLYASLLFLKSSEEGSQTTLHCAMCDVDELKLVEPAQGAKLKDPVSPYFVECGNQTLQSLLRYGWDVEEADRIVQWGKRLVGLPAKNE